MTLENEPAMLNREKKVIGMKNGGVAVLNSVVREGSTEEVTFEQSLKEVRERARQLSEERAGESFTMEEASG